MRCFKWMKVSIAFILINVPLKAIAFNDWEAEFKSLLDFRGIYTDETITGFDQGLGKARYGGNGIQQQSLLRLAEVSLIGKLDVAQVWHIEGHIKYDREQKQALDIVEGFVRYQFDTGLPVSLSVRTGAFFPPFSMENRGTAWSSVYSISSSAINSWIGEELRTLGTEFTLAWKGNKVKAAGIAAIFKANDAAGSLLAWRGWAIHDRESGLFDRIPLAAIPSITTQIDTATGTTSKGSFSSQALWVEPFHEIDGRWGSYIGVQGNIDRQWFANIFHYDNQANPKAFNKGQYAWRTRFDSIGFRWKITAKQELLSQYMQGITKMGALDVMVDNSYRSWYVLLSQILGKQQRISVRYEQFQVNDNDNVVDDNNKEQGDAWTLAYLYYWNQHHRLLLEGLYIDSERAVRKALGEAIDTQELQWQINYRWVWK